MLLASGRDLVLRRDGGGVWRLDAPRRVWKLLGRRVRLTGIRDEFDLLAVDGIEAL